MALVCFQARRVVGGSTQCDGGYVMGSGEENRLAGKCFAPLEDSAIQGLRCPGMCVAGAAAGIVVLVRGRRSEMSSNFSLINNNEREGRVREIGYRTGV